MNIKQALARLDPDESTHWTSDGLPRIDAVSLLVQREVKRQEIVEAAPTFTRDAARAARAEGGDFFANAGPVVSPTTAPQPKAEIAGDVSVLKLPLQTVLQSPELTERAWRELEAAIQEKQKQKRAIEAELEKLIAHSQFLSMQKDRQTRADPNAAQRDIHAYLARTNEARERRAERARQFIEAGTTAADVKEQLRTRSKLDEAMERKTARGGQRPPARMPMHEGTA